MMAVALTGIARRLDPGRFTGPIFAKELRVLSRRRRSYILRLVYVVLLTVFAVGAYLSVAEAGGGDPSTIYRMSKAGKTVIGTIAWFQFLGLQLIATVSMSTAISEETRRGTLAALMSTPISTVQIVVGKVLGKLLQMATLAAASLPVLIVVRVFGGVPWDFVLGATCVSLTAVLLAGTTALFFSALVRQAYAAILLSLASGFALHLVLPWTVSMPLGIVAGATRSPGVFGVVFCVSPFAAMGFMTVRMADPSAGAQVAFYWPVHCLLMLGVWGGLVAACAAVVKNVAMRNAFGGPVPIGPPPLATIRPWPPRPVPPPSPAASAPAAPPLLPATPMPPVLPTAPAKPPPLPAPAKDPPSTLLREIRGSPLIWRSLRAPSIPGRTLRIVVIVVAAAMAALTYAVLGLAGSLDEPGVHATYVAIYLVAAMAYTAVSAAIPISSEKESRTLPILLTTPLGDWHILWASVLEAARRSLPAWAFLLGHAVVFSAFLVIHPVILLQLPLLAAGTALFLSGTGLYFSTSFRRIAPAVVMNLAVVLVLWAMLPWVGGVTAGAAGRAGREANDAMLAVNPIVQAWTFTEAAGKRYHGELYRLEYDLPGGTWNLGEATILLVGAAVAHAGVGMLLLWRAKVKLRRNLF